MTEDAVRQWLRRYDAIAEADREALRRRGPRPEWSISAALSLIQAASPGWRSSPSLRALREQEDRAVGATWQLLRRRLPP
jgi:hypothetical protein